MAEVPRHEMEHKHPAGDRIVDSHETSHHVVPVKVYWIVITWLMVLLFITLGVAAVDFSHVGSGQFAWVNIVVAVTVAVIKAVLIILYFMHVRYSSKLVWVFAGAAFFWVFILFSMTMVDYFSRPESLEYLTR